jgi:hypothetical protein
VASRSLRSELTVQDDPAEGVVSVDHHAPLSDEPSGPLAHVNINSTSVTALVATRPSPADVSRVVAEEVRGLIGVVDAGVCRYGPDGTTILVVGIGEVLGRLPHGTRWAADDVASIAEVWHTGRPARFDACVLNRS